MSSFMVADSTINRITHHVFDNKPHLLRQLADAKLPTTPDAFAWALICLNTAALEDRYGKEDADKATPHDPYEYKTPRKTVSPIQLLKSIACFLYQCSEGAVPNHPLYKFMSELRGDLAEKIVSDLPEWNDAEWG
jgi:hypothetical protein